MFFVLLRIGAHIVEFLTVNQTVTARHGRGVTPHDRVFHTLRVGDEHPVWLGPAGIAKSKEAADARAVEHDPLRRRDIAEFDEGWKDIDVGGKRLHRTPPHDLPRGIVNKEWNPVPALICAPLASAHPAVKNPGGHGSVICREDEDGIFSDPAGSKKLPQAADVAVDVGDHAKIVAIGDPIFAGVLFQRVIRMIRERFFVEVSKLLGCVHRAVGGIGRDHSKKGLAGGSPRCDELPGRSKPDVGAVTVVFLRHAIVPVGVVKVCIVPEVRRLSYATPSVPDHLVKAAFFRAIRVIVPEVPLPEKPSRIAGIGKNITHGDFIHPQHRAPLDGVPDSGAVCPVTGVEGAARRSAGRRHMVVLKPDTLSMQGIEVRGLN